MDDHDDGNDKANQSDSGTWDFVGDETQIFDSQFCDSPTSSFGNKRGGDTDKFYDIQNTIPFDDTIMCDYELATQVMDLDGETQGVNHDTEVDEVDVFDETQLFNDYDTEEIVVSDLEGSEKTEIVDDSDEDNPKNDCNSEKQSSGVGFKKFTSIRAASMRAFGLAALNKATKLGKSPSCPNLSSEPDMEHRRILLEKSQSRDFEKVNVSSDSQETGSKCRFGRSIARKLFADDPVTETKDANDNIDLGGLAKDANDNFDLGGSANSPVLDGELAGLSYIDSQEPGDASQANALDFVDNFLKVNIECDIRKSTGGKSKAVSSAKGVQTFAKSVSLINGVDKRRVFDWDENLEDEGGGEFFRKKKDLFFASGGRRLKGSESSRSCGKLARSDSKLVLGKNKEENKLKKRSETVIKDSTFCKNLFNELDKESTDVPGGKDVQETTESTRFDTQMAAEAMEDLFLGLQETGHELTKINAGSNYKKNGHKKSQPLSLSNNGVRITRSMSKKVTRSKSAAKKIETLDDVAKITRKKSLKRRVDSVEAPVDQMSVKKQCIQPVALRTRQKDIITPTGLSPKNKRSCQKLKSKTKEIDTQSVSRLTRSKAASLTKQEKGLTKEKNVLVCNTPVSRVTPVKKPSPICMGDEYLKQSCRKPSLVQEVCNNLFPTGSLVQSPNKDTRQKKDVSLIRVVFSRHLDGDIIKHQKKILSRLGASESSSMSDATHFIADEFVRTRNMLEAIAFGKPVVTHHWLESCEKACCHIDEKKFILRDVKKEKEFGFNLPTSLARSRQIPLLKGYRVLITPNTKPGKVILSSLVKAVHGVAVERMGRSVLNNDKVLERLLILSCEEDYAVCLPFLEKGAAIYSSELLLNGIVTQRLEYERHRLFLDHVKRT